MLLPIWPQTLFRNGDCPYGNFLSPCPFRHGDSPYGYGDWYFCLPLSHGCAGAPPKILAKKLKFPAQPLHHIETGSYHSHTGIEKPLITVPIQGLPYGNGDSQIPISERGLPVSIQGLK
jgi:hypothetical protein